MNQELISKLIEIAIENGYIKFKKFNIYEDNEIYAREIDKYINLYELITSKPFIDSICKYLWENKKEEYKPDGRITYRLRGLGSHFTDKDNKPSIFRMILANHIYDGTLEQFIKSIVE